MPLPPNSYQYSPAPPFPLAFIPYHHPPYPLPPVNLFRFPVLPHVAPLVCNFPFLYPPPQLPLPVRTPGGCCQVGSDLANPEGFTEPPFCLSKHSDKHSSMGRIEDFTSKPCPKDSVHKLKPKVSTSIEIPLSNLLSVDLHAPPSPAFSTKSNYSPIAKCDIIFDNQRVLEDDFKRDEEAVETKVLLKSETVCSPQKPAFKKVTTQAKLLMQSNSSVASSTPAFVTKLVNRKALSYKANISSSPILSSVKIKSEQSNSSSRSNLFSSNEFRSKPSFELNYCAAAKANLKSEPQAHVSKILTVGCDESTASISMLAKNFESSVKITDAHNSRFEEGTPCKLSSYATVAKTGMAADEVKRHQVPIIVKRGDSLSLSNRDSPTLAMKSFRRKQSSKQKHENRSAVFKKRIELLSRYRLELADLASKTPRRRGKERETPKKKRLSLLKKGIVNDRQFRRFLREQAALAEVREAGASKELPKEVKHHANSKTEMGLPANLSSPLVKGVYEQVGTINVAPPRFKELESILEPILCTLADFGDRAFKNPDLNRAKKQNARRIVCGFHEAIKHLKLRRAKFIVMAVDLEKDAYKIDIPLQCDSAMKAEDSFNNMNEQPADNSGKVDGSPDTINEQKTDISAGAENSSKITNELRMPRVRTCALGRVIQGVVQLAMSIDCPVVLAFRRRKLQSLCHKGAPVSVTTIINFAGVEEKEKLLMNTWRRLTTSAPSS